MRVRVLWLVHILAPLVGDWILSIVRFASKSVQKMVAIGLLDIPPEIHLQIAEFVETRRSLKALSVTSRSLRSIAQSKLFERLEIDIATGLRGSVDDLLANPRLCPAIRAFAGTSWMVPVPQRKASSQRRRESFTYQKNTSRDGWIKRGVDMAG